MQAYKRNTKRPSGWRATCCPSHRRPGSGLGTGVEVGGRKIEQEAEADTADDQAREHDLVNTSAPMPANPKHIDITISIAIHSHIFCKHASKHDEVCSVGAKKPHEVIASASAQPWIARAEDQYPQRRESLQRCNDFRQRLKCRREEMPRWLYVQRSIDAITDV